MTDDRIRQIERRIDAIKTAVAETGSMRPGSLTRQYRNSKEKKNAFWQLSYTRRQKSRTEYVRPEHVDAIRSEVAAYKKFKCLVDEWVDLAIEQSRLRMNLEPLPPDVEK